jgi:hypothetical protein
MLCPRKRSASGLIRFFTLPRENTPERQLLLEVARRGEPFRLHERLRPKRTRNNSFESMRNCLDVKRPSLDVYEVVPRGDKGRGVDLINRSARLVLWMIRFFAPQESYCNTNRTVIVAQRQFSRTPTLRGPRWTEPIRLIFVASQEC